MLFFVRRGSNLEVNTSRWRANTDSERVMFPIEFCGFWGGGCIFSDIVCFNIRMIYTQTTIIMVKQMGKLDLINKQ